MKLLIKKRRQTLSDANKTINRNNMQEITERILDCNQLNQSGQGLKIFNTKPNAQQITNLVDYQLKAGNNSEKLKNEIRQILYSLYRSKKLTKQTYKSLIDII